MRSWFASALMTGSTLCTLVCCSPSDDETDGHAGPCTPGTAVVCRCEGGAASTALCRADGSGAGACACASVQEAGTASQTNGANAARGDASTPSMSATDGGAPRDGSPGDASMTNTPPGNPMSGTDSGAALAGPATPSVGCGNASPPTGGSMMMDVEGTMRQYIVKVPAPYDPSQPHRLVFAWHGLGGTAMQIASTYYGLATRASSSAIFIAAQGLPNPQQNNLAAWANKNDVDVTFTRKLLEWAKENYCIDTKRVFSIGMSNGGMMSNIVGCEMGDSIRAIAAMSGGGPRGYAAKPCVGQVAVWISHGNKDNNVPFSYGQMSRDYWTMTNHCGTETAPAMPGTCVEYQGCDTGFPVQFCEFDGGHMVPAFTGEAAWKFFERF
jgi:polyhydroxybutyrate depolymerase